jgi:hypothetical protein
MKLRDQAIRCLMAVGFGIVSVTAVTGVANAEPPSPRPSPPPNPGGYYGSAYQEVLDLGLTDAEYHYDENGNFILPNMFGTVCNNPGFVCM